MKIQLLTLCAALLGGACGPGGEPAGSAAYFLDNQSAVSLRVEATLSPALGGGQEVLATVPAATVAELYRDGAIGQNPRPPDSFAAIQVFRVDTLARVYLQDPVVDGPWTSARQDQKSYGLTHFTLVLKDSHLSP